MNSLSASQFPLIHALAQRPMKEEERSQLSKTDMRPEDWKLKDHEAKIVRGILSGNPIFKRGIEPSPRPRTENTTPPPRDVGEYHVS